MGMAGTIFKLHSSNFEKVCIFYRFSNDITIIFRNFHYCKSFKKCTQAIRPGVDESLAKVILPIFQNMSMGILEHLGAGKADR